MDLSSEIEQIHLSCLIHTNTSIVLHMYVWRNAGNLGHIVMYLRQWFTESKF